MYAYEFDPATRGYRLCSRNDKYVGNEIRPVFAPELAITGLDSYFEYDPLEKKPLLWGIKNTYLVADIDDSGRSYGRKVAQINNARYGAPLEIQTFFSGRMKLLPVDVQGMLKANTKIMTALTSDAKRRAKEMYDAHKDDCDMAYISFSGGKDSVVLLDICQRVLPLSVPVVFSDTDMEFPDTYKVWSAIMAEYPDREFITAKTEKSALEYWKLFGPPSRTIRWCCSVLKSTPALIALKKKLRKDAIELLAFVGVRGEESQSRSKYEDISNGAKNASQINCMPILDWGAHELWLYIFANNLIVNHAYTFGIARVGCLMCPESSPKHLWYVGNCYPNHLKQYMRLICETSIKNLKNIQNRNEYINNLNWQARRSGALLNNNIIIPSDIIIGLSVIFNCQSINKYLFLEWIKTLGKVYKIRQNDSLNFIVKNNMDDNIYIYITCDDIYITSVKFIFQDKNIQTEMLPHLRALIRKATFCVNCGTCEANCLAGAISTADGLFKIDENKCIQCHSCYKISVANCWRCNSMRNEVNQNNIKIGFSSYFTFGLREKWIAVLMDIKEDFFNKKINQQIGNKMIDSARPWFQQALLIESKTKNILPLLKIFQKNGSASTIGWEFIWIALANNSNLIKWFVSDTTLNHDYTTKELSNKLQCYYPQLSESAKDDGCASLRDILAKSPLSGENAVSEITFKGKQAQSITRKSKEIAPLTILYGLYLAASLAKRANFTVREMLSANIDAIFISPIVAFGIPPETFKKQCEGLRTRYPDYIATTFTHGNDGLEVYPQKYGLDDIIALALEN